LPFAWKNKELVGLSEKMVWYTSILRDQVHFTTRSAMVLAILGVGVPIAGALSDESAGLGILIASVSISIFVLSKSIPEEVKGAPFSEWFQSQPWSLMMGISVFVVIGLNVGFSLILL
jgi:hypothetical protein